MADLEPRPDRSLLRLLERWLGTKSGAMSPPSNALADLFSAPFSPIGRYHEYWRKRIRDASSGLAVCNGWAYSTWSGLATFEHYITVDQTIRKVYEDRAASLERAAECVGERSQAKRGQSLGGVMVYGYGNLKRESQFLQCLTAELRRKFRTYLLDCSPFYHLLARSSMNPALRHLDARRMRTVLIDFETTTAGASMKWVRNDLNPFRTVLHVFLGNTFSNLEASVVRELLDNYTLPGDLILAEYANYSGDFFSSLDEDYASAMARRACAELFGSDEGSVRTENTAHGQEGKCVAVKYSHGNGQCTEFRSMLRRQFKPVELLSGPYSQVLDELDAIPGLTKVAVFQRHP